ncbi:MAG: MFS transporter, partial [Chloroflexota bacterium]
MSPAGLSVERVAPVFFLLLVDVLGLTVILPLLHLYAAKFGATPLQIGMVVAAFPIAQLVGVPMMGALSDRFGRKPLLLISQVTTCASFVLLGLANTLWLVILSRMIDGLFGANIATAQAALTDISSEEDRARALGLTGAAFGIGFVLGPLISAISLSFTDRLSIPAFIAAGYSLLSIILTATLFKETL